MKIKVQDIAPAKYNPRKMDDKTKKALKASMDQFNDISGITWNRVTGNIVTGHHRWSTLIDLHGEKNLDFKELSTDRYAIQDKKTGNDTGFILRAVEWDKAKEKAANVAANSDKIAGQFTADLKDVLADIENAFDIDFFEELRLDDLEIPSFISDDEGWETDIGEVERTESNLDGIITTIKIECSQEMRSEVFSLINTLITDKGLSTSVKVK
jgi:hypothetical protein